MTKDLVYIGKIVTITSIEDADFIVAAEVICGAGGRWVGIVKKTDNFEVGDLCTVYLQDSLLPETEEFAFMERAKYRVKMMKLRGVRSEVLITKNKFEGDVGDDVTEQAGVKKYIKPVPACISGETKGAFPGFVPKTDEPNFQIVENMVNSLVGMQFYATEKADGTSATIFMREDDNFGCCGRNWEYRESDRNAMWKIAKTYNVFETMKEMGGYLAFQFEVVGPGIQKNPMGLQKIEPRLFNIYDIRERFYYDAEDLFDIAEMMKFPVARKVMWNEKFRVEDISQLQRYAEGFYDSGKPREGIVLRPMQETIVAGERLSFKVINLDYKDEGE